MNYQRISRLIGILLVVLAGCMLTSVPWSWYYNEPSTIWAFVYSAGITAAIGGGAWWYGHHDKGTIFRAEAIVVVGLSWLLLGVFGGLPYMFDGAFTNPADAYFEAISGFTTTGSTVLTDIAGQSYGLHWWRTLTHWLGGMGIIVLFVAIFPQLGVGGKFLFKSEVPGPITEGLKPKIKSTASMLWWIYVGFTVTEALILKGWGMTWHDAFTHSFATMATGGFSTKNGSVGEFDSAFVDYTITLFMIFAGINFGLYYELFRGKAKSLLRDREFWTYLGLVGVATLMVTINIYDAVHDTIADSFRYAIFQVVGVVTTTGFGTDNFDVYPPLSRLLLVLLMFVGGMAGSTAGGMKIIRFMVVVKAIYGEVYKTFRPQSVMAVRVGRSVIPQRTVMAILGFFAVGMLVFGLSSLYMAAMGLDIVTATTSVAATLFNIGPGLARVGSVENFAFIRTDGKILLSLCMIFGRLEFMTLLVLLLPEFWKR
ncbi:TrkH family potassium uptake protein [Persicimonas caeni]|uniref:TrkH family potassium uptake protein n=1 Tax=Persicimonas caeni TaxID=2292766 RepID=A0A4Y6PNL7_PERCE|nr:TrkH family potassium uptake protein [Persicimonas caeni]QDG49840.1 TrkH family potassium uptake protein [Persicimonas caeni]QED31061.1 TrkH family potassium uptake protein [Persicimonas caeni]